MEMFPIIRYENKTFCIEMNICANIKKIVAIFIVFYLFFKRNFSEKYY